MTAASRVGGDGAVPVRDAATVVLLRDGADGVEAWLLTRVTGMQFAAGMSVFPGGRVESGDADLPMTGGDLAGMAARFDCAEPAMRALVGAAVRETFEEAGVLLTAPPGDLTEHRAAVEAGEMDFGDLLQRHGLAVDASALHPWSRWVTPEGEVRRYDTRFFVGALPKGAVATDATTESSEAAWVPVRTAIEQGQRGERGLLPPTMLTLDALAACATVEEVLAAAETTSLEPVRPVLHIGDDQSVQVELPDGRMLLVRPGRPS